MRVSSRTGCSPGLFMLSLKSHCLNYCAFNTEPHQPRAYVLWILAPGRRLLFFALHRFVKVWESACEMTRTCVSTRTHTPSSWDFWLGPRSITGDVVDENLRVYGEKTSRPRAHSMPPFSQILSFFRRPSNVFCVDRVRFFFFWGWFLRIRGLSMLK